MSGPGRTHPGRPDLEVALDLGSASVKAVAMDAAGRVMAAIRRDIRGRLRLTVDAVLEELQASAPTPVSIVAVTGSRAGEVARALSVPDIAAIVAVHCGAARLAPGAGAVLELGGESARFLRFGAPDPDGLPALLDFEVNAACSAGTGAFLEQEAHRFGMTIQDFGRRAAASKTDLRIAGRCAVFAKTDAVHKHQNGVPLDDIAWALCHAVAQGACSELIGKAPFVSPLAVVGGVAANPGVIRALREVLGDLADGLVVPENHDLAAAVGAVLAARSRGDEGRVKPSRARQLIMAAPNRIRADDRLPALPRPSARAVAKERRARSAASRTGDRPILGVDIGSTSTNAVLLGPGREVLKAVSAPTRGDPLRAATEVVRRLESVCGCLRPRAVGVTGSGRRMVSELLGADFAVNEITAHAEGCARFYPDADTVFDIGGQDSKYMRLAAGAVTGFEMNKVCSAGTGSFLEEMASLLGLEIVGEFEREALGSASPEDLGERCTVFMASEVSRRLQEGAAREDLAAGLAYAVARNYLSRVVGRHPVGERIILQGGVASNAAVVSALRQLLGRPVEVHAWNDTAGAIGVAVMADRRTEGDSRFRGVASLDPSRLQVRSFVCPRCENRCTVHVTRAAGSPGGPGGPRFFAGGLCDRYEGRGRPTGSTSVPGLDLWAEREAALEPWVERGRPEDPDAVWIPRALLFHDRLPFWAAFLDELDVPFAVTGPTGPDTLELGASVARRGTCLPLRTAYGHVSEILAAGPRRVLVPSVAGLQDGTREERLGHACPAVQAWPFTTRALLPPEARIVSPRLRLSMSSLAERDVRALGRSFGCGARQTRRAFEAGQEAQRSFREAMHRRGDEVLQERDGRNMVALLGRPYTLFDARVRVRLTRVLDDVGLAGVPADMIRDEPASSDDLHGMYWYYGKRMLQAARSIRSLENLPVITLSSFGCGPDAFILHMLRRELGPTPTLELEVDEHSEFNGVHTRVEAFRWALGSPRPTPDRAPAPPGATTRQQLKGRRLQLPLMSDHAVAIAAAFRSCGVDARAMPLPNPASIALGRDALDGGECLPCSFILGDMLHRLENGDGEPPPAFFMISGDGPCRLGQYPWLFRAVLDGKGHSDVPIFNASQDPRFYEHFGLVPAEFQRRAWVGTVASDLLYRKGRHVRSRASDRTRADQEYERGLADLEGALERGEDPRASLVHGFDRLEAVPTSCAAPEVTIAVLGENYIRCNPVANADLAESLEALGAEVWFPSLCEWVMYTNWTARLHCRYERQPRRLLRLLAIDAIQRRDIGRISAAVRGRLPDTGFPTVTTLLRLAEPYVPASFEGETVWGVGRTVDFCRRGVGGVIHVAPFGCMVGGVVESLGHRLSADLGGFPMLHLQYDGRPDEHPAGLLEGFVHRARAWQDRPSDPRAGLARSRDRSREARA